MRNNYNSHLSELDKTKMGKLAHKLSHVTGQDWYTAMREIRQNNRVLFKCNKCHQNKWLNIPENPEELGIYIKQFNFICGECANGSNREVK